MTLGGPFSFTMTLFLGDGQSEAIFCGFPVNCIVCADQVKYKVNIQKGLLIWKSSLLYVNLWTNPASSILILDVLFHSLCPCPCQSYIPADRHHVDLKTEA